VKQRINIQFTLNGQLKAFSCAPAVANAVCDAVGVRIRDLPLTPEKVWKAMKAQ